MSYSIKTTVAQTCCVTTFHKSTDVTSSFAEFDTTLQSSCRVSSCPPELVQTSATMHTNILGYTHQLSVLCIHHYPYRFTSIHTLPVPFYINTYTTRTALHPYIHYPYRFTSIHTLPVPFYIDTYTARTVLHPYIHYPYRFTSIHTLPVPFYIHSIQV